MKGTISILVPVFQGRPFVGRCLQSVLQQTYKNIELIVIDDGSTDGTKEFIESFETDFADLGMRLVCLRQENAGQASAINYGLKHVTGDYVAWFDSDDVLQPFFAEALISCLNNRPDADFAVGQLAFVNETRPDRVLFIKKRVPPVGYDSFFDDLLEERNIVFGSGCLVVRKDYLFRRLKNREILTNREGQNWQLMLPITYHGKCVYYDAVVAKIFQRPSSHSRHQRTPRQIIDRYRGFIDLLNGTIARMDYCPESEAKTYKKKVLQVFSEKIFAYAYMHKMIADCEWAYAQMSALQTTTSQTERERRLLKPNHTLAYWFDRLSKRALRAIRRFAALLRRP